MSKSKKLNRDHAKKTQRPMVEDGVIAHQLEALLTPAITNQENYYRQSTAKVDHIQIIDVIFGLRRSLSTFYQSIRFWQF